MNTSPLFKFHKCIGDLRYMHAITTPSQKKVEGMKHYAGKLKNYALEGKDPMDIPKNHIKTIVKKISQYKSDFSSK